MIGATASQSQDQQQQHHHQQQQQQHQQHGQKLANANNNQQQSQQSQQQQHHHQSHHQHLVNHRTSNANQQLNADDDYQDDHGMRVGNNYQAEIPQFIAYAPAPEYYEEEKAIRVWSPHNKIPEHVLDEFINKSREKFYYNTEQALGMLSWHKFDLNRAYADLPNFVPYPNEWSVEDKVLFEQAYQFHEKQFNKIKQMLPDKTMANLISYYYSWKKTRIRASLMERQTRRFAARKTADSNGTSDDEEEEEVYDNEEDFISRNRKQATEERENNAAAGNDQKLDCSCEAKGIADPEINCFACNKELRVHGKIVNVIVDSMVDNFCTECYSDYRSGKKKIVTETELGDCFYQPSGEPKRILFSYNDVLSLKDGIPEAGDLMLKHLDAQVQDVKRDIQTKKQTLSQINEKIQPIADQIAELNMEEFSAILPEYKPTKIWTTEETQLVIQGLRRYGKDFSAISDVVRTKSPESVKLFYVSQKERLGLHILVREFEDSKESSQLPQDQRRPQDSETKTPTDVAKSTSSD